MKNENAKKPSMTRLNKSVRRAFSCYGQKFRLRSGYWRTSISPCGDSLDGVQFLRRAFCDVRDGEVTDVRLYSAGDAMEPRDRNGLSVDITWEVQDFLSDPNIRWDDFILSICERIQSETEENLK